MRLRKAITVVELVMVMAIVVMAMSLSLTLIRESQERVRRSECANNLRQIGASWVAHEAAHNYFPSSGWGWLWTGDPDRGAGRAQPGGWLYSTLPYTGYSHISTRGAFLGEPARSEAILASMRLPVAMINCPSRRDPIPYPTAWFGSGIQFANVRGPAALVVRSDYRANSGSIEVGVPRSVEDRRRPLHRGNGVTFAASETRLSQIQDGLSQTICVAEKYLNPDAYTTGYDVNDNESAYAGYSNDNNGFTVLTPIRDRRGLVYGRFGSAHESGLYVANCDASVRFVNYSIELSVFRAMGGRSDGE